MANESSAGGILYITASSTTECKEICELIDIITQNWRYYFETYDELIVSEVIIAHHEESNDEVTMEIPFTAEGRWTFQNNAEKFGAWLQHSHTPETDVEIHEAVLKLTGYKFVLEFEYDEDEPGEGFVAVGKTKLFHAADTSLDTSEILESGIEIYPLTVENLVKYRDFEEDYAKDYLGENENESNQYA